MSGRFPVTPGPSNVSVDSLAGGQESTSQSLIRNRRGLEAQRYLYRIVYDWLSPSEYRRRRGFLQEQQVQFSTFDFELPYPDDRLEGGQNFLYATQRFDSSTWTDVGSPVIAADVLTAPDGTTTGDTIEDNSASTREGVEQNPTAEVLTLDERDDRDYMSSVYVGKDTVQTRCALLKLNFWSGGTFQEYGVGINTETGDIAARDDATSQDVAVQSIDSNWWRLSVRGRNTKGNTRCEFEFFPAAIAGADPSSFLSNSTTGTVGVWGAQVERAAGRLPGPYYPMAGSTSPRVMGASQIGRQLDTENWHPSFTCMKMGDMFQLTNHPKIYTITQDAFTDAQGETTLHFEPPLIQSPNDNEALKIQRLYMKVSLVDQAAVRTPPRNTSFYRNPAYSFLEDPYS